MAELSRWLIAIGATAAWTGFTILGIGMSTLVPSSPNAGSPWIARLLPGTIAEQGGLISVIGLIGFVIGIILYRSSVEPDESTR